MPGRLLVVFYVRICRMFRFDVGAAKNTRPERGDADALLADGLSFFTTRRDKFPEPWARTPVYKRGARSSPGMLQGFRMPKRPGRALFKDCVAFVITLVSY